MSGSARLVFVADLEAPALDDDDRHHLARVLRVREGEVLRAGDGAGRWRPCRLGPGGVLEPSGEVVEVEAPSPVLTIGIALTKGARPELAVQKLTELGIDRILPLVAARSIARWQGERAERHLVRLRRVAREAAMQSQRLHLPQVSPVYDLPEAASLPGAVLAHPGGDPPSLATTVVLVGPEGGWSDEELAMGLPRVGLGPGVLRAETAAMAAGTLLGALRHGMVAEVAPAERPGEAGHSVSDHDRS